MLVFCVLLRNVRELAALGYVGISFFTLMLVT